MSKLRAEREGTELWCKWKLTSYAGKHQEWGRSLSPRPAPLPCTPAQQVCVWESVYVSVCEYECVHARVCVYDSAPKRKLTSPNVGDDIQSER